MADVTTNATREAWERTINKLKCLNEKLIASPEKDRAAIECAVADQEEDVLETPAPSFSAVVQKLYILWDAQLLGIDPETEAKRLILEDLERLVLDGADLLGSSAEPASLLAS